VDGSIFYVGIGNKERRAYRFYGRNAHWTNTYNKYGVDVEIVARDLSWELACELEQLMIAEYGRIDLHTGSLANLTDGGEGTLGTKHSQETKDKRANSNRGKKRTQETRLKISQSLMGKKLSEQHIEKLRTSHLGQLSSNAQQVVDLQTGFFYDSLRNGCLSVGVSYKAEVAKIKRGSKKVRFQIL